MTDTKRTPDIETTITFTPTGEPDYMALSFANGEIIRVRPAEFPRAIIAQALMHGFKQKLVDAAAISRNPETGRAASIGDKFDAVNEVYQRLLAGEWNKVREGTPTGGLLLAALIRFYPMKSRDDLVARLAGMSEKEQAALRLNPRIAGIIATIRAERAGADSIDSDALLDDMG